MPETPIRAVEFAANKDTDDGHDGYAAPRGLQAGWNVQPGALTAAFVGRDAELSWLLELWRQATLRTEEGEYVGGPRMGLVIAETGIGKSKLVQEFYRRLTRDPQWDPPGEAYWPDAFTGSGLQLNVNPEMGGEPPQGAPRFLWLGTRWKDPGDRQGAVRHSAIPDLRERLALHVALARKHGPVWQRARSAYARAIRREGIEGGLSEVAEEGVGKVVEALAGGLPFGGLLVKAAFTASEIFREVATYAEEERAQRRTLSEEFHAELREVFGGFGSGGLVLPTVLWLDDAQWIDPETLDFLYAVWDEAVERRWPLFVIVTHWEREWRLLGAQAEGDRAQTLHRYATQPGAEVWLLGPAATAELKAVLLQILPGLTPAQQQVMLDKARGNYLSLIENAGELLAEPENFRGADVAGPLSRAGEKLVATWESDRDRRIRQRFAALDPQLRRVLAWSSRAGQRFLKDFLARFVAARLRADGRNAEQLIDRCIDPYAILAAPSPLFREFRDRSFHRVAREHFERYLSDDDESELAAALRGALTGWINGTFDAQGVIIVPDDPGEGALAAVRYEPKALLTALSNEEQVELLRLAVLELPLPPLPDWNDPAQVAALRARLWLASHSVRDRPLTETAAEFASLPPLDWAAIPGPVLAGWLLERTTRLAGLASAHALHEALARRCLRLIKDRLPAGTTADADLSDARMDVADALYQQGGYVEAEAELLALLADQLEPAMPDLRPLTRTHLLLARVLIEREQPEVAEMHAQEALRLDALHYGDESFRRAVVMGEVATVLIDVGRLAEAEQLLEQTLGLQRRLLTEGMWSLEHAKFGMDVAGTLADLGYVRLRLGKHAEAEPPLTQALDHRIREVGPDNPLLARIHEALGALHLETAQPARALEHARTALAIREAAWGADHRLSLMPRRQVAAAYLELQDPAAARPHLEAVLDLVTRLQGAQSRGAADAMFRMGQLCRMEGDDRQALEWLDRAAATFAAVAPDHSTLADVRREVDEIRGAPASDDSHAEP